MGVDSFFLSAGDDSAPRCVVPGPAVLTDIAMILCLFFGVMFRVLGAVDTLAGYVVGTRKGG